MIVMIVQYPGGFYHNQIAAAVRRLGVECRLVSWMDFDPDSIGSYSPERTLVFLRTCRPINIARAFESRGIRVLNDSRYTTLSGNKLLGNLYARANGIPVPELCVEVDKAHDEVLRTYLREYGSLVVKPIYSRDMGAFVYRVREETAQADLKQVATIPGHRVLVQSEIEFDRLVRTVVLGRRMLVQATTYDTVHPPEWKATVCMNPQVKAYENPPQRLVELAERTSLVFGGEVAYIDFFEQADGELVLSEINHSCALQHHEAVTGVPIHRHIGQYLVERYRELVHQEPARAAA